MTRRTRVSPELESLARDASRESAEMILGTPAQRA
jgi:hypothetical protein